MSDEATHPAGEVGAQVGVGHPDADLAKVGELARDAASPGADNRGPVDFKRDMVRVWTVRTVRRALDRAKGGR